MTPSKSKDTERLLVSFLYPCYVCGDNIRRAHSCIAHIFKIHKVKLSTRGVGHRRPSSVDFKYHNRPEGKVNELRYACPSCWYHCPSNDIDSLAKHITETHGSTADSMEKINREINKNNEDENEDASDDANNDEDCTEFETDYESSQEELESKPEYKKAKNTFDGSHGTVSVFLLKKILRQLLILTDSFNAHANTSAGNSTNEK